MPALALIDILVGKKNSEIIFAGRKYNLDSEQSYSLEFQEIEKRKLKFIPTSAGRAALKNFFQIVFGLIHALKIVNKEKPDIIFSFGSYIGFPFAFAGWVLQIPSFVHEQTLFPGFANRLGAFFAKKVFVSFPQSSRFFNKEKVVISGNPVRKEIFETRSKPFRIDKKLPVIYVTGGSLGSHSINLHLLKILPKLLEKNIVIHQTGNVKEYQDYETLLKMKESLPKELQLRYFLREHIYSHEIGYIYSLADLVISRSGANIFFELVALKKPAILIPLPWSARQEQQKQADLFVHSGLGEIFSQFDESEKLLNLIDKMLANLMNYQKKFTNLDFLYKQDAVETIYQHILKQ